MHCLHEVYNEKGSFLGYILTIQNACPTVKAFHRMNLDQNKCLNSLNSNTASNMAGKVAKPIKNGRKQGRMCMIEFHFFGMPIKTLGSLGKIRVGRVTGNTHIIFFGLMYFILIVCFSLHHLSLVVRKLVFGVSDQIRHKPGCTAIEDC